MQIGPKYKQIGHLYARACLVPQSLGFIFAFSSQIAALSSSSQNKTNYTLQYSLFSLLILKHQSLQGKLYFLCITWNMTYILYHLDSEGFFLHHLGSTSKKIAFLAEVTPKAGRPPSTNKCNF